MVGRDFIRVSTQDIREQAVERMAAFLTAHGWTFSRPDVPMLERTWENPTYPRLYVSISQTPFSLGAAIGVESLGTGVIVWADYDLGKGFEKAFEEKIIHMQNHWRWQF
jgi:hypothetical protein